MTRGGAEQAYAHYKGKDETFIVYVDDVAAAESWKTDKSIPLAQVVGSFKIFITHKQGLTGQKDGASNQVLDNEFGTHVEEEVIKTILEKGSIQTTEFSERSSTTNDSKGPRGGH